MLELTQNTFKSAYGPWALVAGASAGLGAAFAEALAARGLDLVLVARREPELLALGERLRTSFGVAVRPISLDLSTPDAASRLAAEFGELDVGLFVYNAALSLIGPFLEQPLEAHLRELDTNCRAPLSLAHTFGQRMQARGRGGIVLMSSLAGYQGGPFLANYAATKAYTTVLAEGLWAELGPRGIDVIACCAGAIATPGYAHAAPARTSRFAPARLRPETVVAETLAALGRRPTHVPGRSYRFSQFLLQRLLPRRAAIRLMERNIKGLRRTPRS